jgi:hypothetical protein
MWRRADRCRELGVDQFPHPLLEQPAEQLLRVTLTEARQQLGNTGIIVGRAAALAAGKAGRRSSDGAGATPTRNLHRHAQENASRCPASVASSEGSCLLLTRTS